MLGFDAGNVLGSVTVGGGAGVWRARMTEELFRDYWWLMFPVFGMVIAILGAARDSAYQDRVIREAREKLERK